MDHAPLVNDERRLAGRKVVELLKDSGFPIHAAFWYWDPEGEEDRLPISSPMVRESGPKAVYDRIEALYRQHPEAPRVRFSQIALLGTDDPRVAKLHSLNYAPGPGTETGAGVLGGDPPLYDVWVYRHLVHPPGIARRR